MSKVTWIHLSDFHFRSDKSPKGKVDDFNRELVLETLLKDISTYPKKNDLQIDFIIITGDLAYSGRNDEYLEAEKFLKELIRIVGIKKSSLFIIPGNHDINRGKIGSQFNLSTPNDITMLLCNKMSKMVQFDRFEDYRNFINRYCVKTQHFDYEDRYFWTKVINKNNTKIGLLGLNSSWNSCGDGDKGQLLIGEKQMEDALEKIADTDLKIAAFHHPFDWLREDDRDDVERRLGSECDFILHGHLHKPGLFIKGTPDYESIIVPAGSCYEKRPYRNSYNYLTYDLDSKLGFIHIRCYSSNYDNWVADNETYKNVPQGVCNIDLNKKERSTTSALERIPERYRNWLNENCHYMDLKNLMAKGKAIQVDLPEVFIKLYSNDPQKLKETFVEKNMGENEQKPVDIEDLVNKNDHLLIEGQAGSGKSTLLKHMAYSVMNKTFGRGLNNHLPVLVFLKDLQDGFDPKNNKAANMEKSKAVLVQYLSSKGLDMHIVEAYCQAKKAIFLLDGLDEIEENFRDVLVDVLADFRTQHPCKMILSGRPHGIDTSVVQRFGKGHIKIHTLKIKQVEEFVKRWFGYIFSKGLVEGRDSAKGLIGDIKAHPNVYELIDNPLMLTAVCILYYDDRRLPDQRAELYKKFIDNLVYRRFNDSEKVKEFLMTLAYKGHIRERRGFGRPFALEVMSDVYPKKAEETDLEYHRRNRKKFEEIEQNCGMIKLDKGEYDFWHLTFQEFLAARYVATLKSDYANEIKYFWDKLWYKEFIELFIGFLSIDAKGWANRIVQEELDREDKSPFKRWLLAAGSLLDIHRNSRDIHVLEKACKNLILIFDIEKEPKILTDAGDILGWLGDPRDLEVFVEIERVKVKQKKLGKTTIKSFEIGKYPVTNRWFEKFIKNGGYQDDTFWAEGGHKWCLERHISSPKNWDDRTFTCPNAPVTGISWYEAVAFSNWLTYIKDDGYLYRLPTVDERQHAEVGPEGRRYAWGNAFPHGRCNSLETRIGRPTPVGIFVEGTTTQGIHDLTGNVKEIVLDTTTKKWEGEHLSDYHEFMRKRATSDHEYLAVGSDYTDSVIDTGTGTKIVGALITRETRNTCYGMRLVRTKNTPNPP